MDIHSEGVVPLRSIPDVICLTGRRSDTAECRILQGRDARSVRVLVPDPRGLDQNFNDVTIVDMGDVPESSVSTPELSSLRQQWPSAVLSHMVWLQQELEGMRKTQPSSCVYCGRWTKCDMYQHVAKFHLEGESPRTTIHAKRRMQPVRVMERSVCDLPVLTLQDPLDGQGAMV